MELGLQAETERDFPAAERFLLEAARVDGTYEPRWTLANYYFRRQDWEKFWIWTRRAAEMAYQDQTALFQLCWRATGDPQVILDRAIPDVPRAEARYLSFLLRTGRLQAAGPVASRLTRQDNGAYVGLLFDYCDHALKAGRTPQALEVWNALCARGLIPYQPLAPEAGRSLTNGDFAAAPLSRGFDWRIPSLQGVSVARTESPQGLRISFSGKQPEMCRVIDQILPLESSRRYSLRFVYRTSVIQPGSGLRWGITDLTSGEELLAGAKDLSSADWTEESLPFSAPPQAGLARLSLVYERTPGTTRIEGSVFLRGISLNLGE